MSQVEKTDETLELVTDAPRGVTRIENLDKNIDKRYLLLFAFSVYLCSWTLALDFTTTTSYQPYATSEFHRHSMISSLDIATTVISAVSKPFVAKFSDMTSRAYAYLLILVLYVMGFIIAACSQSISSYVVGCVFISIGESGVDLMNNVIVADMTPLKWRTAVASMLLTPYLCTTWISGYIVEDILKTNWRWGYGMFAIITPVVLTSAVTIIFVIDHRVNGNGEQLFKPPKVSWKQVREALVEIDALGLVLLGFAFSLILLPCSLYAYANGGWKNPSMIAMEVVGGVLLITYAVYEISYAPFPLLPKAVLLNRTFVCSAFIDFCYQFSACLWVLYFSSYTLVTLNLSYKHWTYFNNTETMGVCFFGVMWGLVFWVFRRYKVFQVMGTAIRMIGIGLLVKASKMDKPPSLGILVAGAVLISFGDASTQMATQLAGQASVPHKNMAFTISILDLFSSIGGAVGQAIAASIWISQLPKKLVQHIQDPTAAYTYFEDISTIYALPWGSSDRLACIKAYQELNYLLFCGALGVGGACFLAAFLQTNYYLGDTQNAVEGSQKEDYTGRWYEYIFDFVRHPLG
ncbi:hypothetical protein OGAPHI_004691 [Ogataea philodendri]|uniref:Siderophore iron transporter n=1 Tax=Ogataea philodendri TaxID=1378263 RepID=A0A9P8P2F9_9ASCO|nr:uncharacterized protein OGAPHI_004691 [Ogataea philodendri]KAH3663977.1 hypothetical protein OGAPHI_004691 [Ogataea philodendri]